MASKKTAAKKAAKKAHGEPTPTVAELTPAPTESDPSAVVDRATAEGFDPSGLHEDATDTSDVVAAAPASAPVAPHPSLDPTGIHAPRTGDDVPTDAPPAQHLLRLRELLANIKGEVPAVKQWVFTEAGGIITELERAL